MRSLLHISPVPLLLLSLAACDPVPLDHPKEVSYALPDTSNTGIARTVSAWLDGDTDTNGFYPLIEGFDAFGARLALMTQAEASIDAQYFLMKPGDAGMVFSEKMLEAADRGVRVRLLLDDIYTTVSDSDFAILDEHPNIEVRLFNPIARQGFYRLNFFRNFKRANRRMHNKALIVDNQVAVVGGRNIASEYYQLEADGEFIDFDMLSAGPVVEQVSAQFDVYWNHKLAVPLNVLYPQPSAAEMENTRARMNREMADAGNRIYAESLETPVMKQFFSETLEPYIAEAQLLADNPEKLLVAVSPEQQIVVNATLEAMAEAESEIIIFTPYFIPRERGIEFIKSLRAEGIRIVALTNSLSTNNHMSVHASYASYRKDLLGAGVELWEARADASMSGTENSATQQHHLTLHTKGMVIDRKRFLGGSLNLDPRSVDINTEMVILIDSPELGAYLSDVSERLIPSIAYRLMLDDDERISWHTEIDGQEVIETREPGTSWWQRAAAWVTKIAPEDQL